MLTALVAVAVPAQAQSVKAGIEAWQKADYSAAVVIWYASTQMKLYTASAT